MAEITEELMSVIRERAAHEMGSALAAEFLSILADRGVINYRQMPEIARRSASLFDIGEITGRLTDEFARSIALPPFPEEG